MDGQSARCVKTFEERRGLKSAAIVLYFRRWWDVVYTSHLVQLYSGFSVTSSPGHVTYFIDLIYWLCPQVVFIYLIILLQVVTCFLSWCLNTLALSHIISMMTTDLFLLLVFERNFPKHLSHSKKRQSFKIQSKYFSQTNRPREARVLVFVLQCSASVTVASHSWMIYFIQNFTCVYMSHQSSTPVRSLIKKNFKKDKITKKKQHVKSVLFSMCLATKINMLMSESAHHY